MLEIVILKLVDNCSVFISLSLLLNLPSAS